MAKLRERGVDALQVEQAELGGGIGFHGRLGLDSLDGTCRLHGSVTCAETLTSTVVPKRSRRDVAST